MRDITLAAVAVVTHGPLDVYVTMNHWHLETNPFVLELGRGPWLALKAILCLGVLGMAFHNEDRDSGTVRACLWFLALLGVLVVLSNGLVILGGFH